MKLFIFPGRHFTNRHRKQYNQTYGLYESVWEKTFQELKDKNYRHYSDNFTGQDYILSLFKNNECIALEALRWINLWSPVDRKNSWLRSWPISTLDALQEEGYREACMNSNLVVSPDYRGANLPYNERISFIISALTTMYMVHIQVPVSLGMTRKDRSVDHIFKLLAAKTLNENLLHNGKPTDLIAQFLPDIKEVSKTFQVKIKDLFYNRTDLTTKDVNYEHVRITA